MLVIVSVRTVTPATTCAAIAVAVALAVRIGRMSAAILFAWVRATRKKQRDRRKNNDCN